MDSLPTYSTGNLFDRYRQVVTQDGARSFQPGDLAAVIGAELEPPTDDEQAETTRIATMVHRLLPSASRAGLLVGWLPLPTCRSM